MTQWFESLALLFDLGNDEVFVGDSNGDVHKMTKPLFETLQRYSTRPIPHVTALPRGKNSFLVAAEPAITWIEVTNKDGHVPSCGPLVETEEIQVTPLDCVDEQRPEVTLAVGYGPKSKRWFIQENYSL